VGCTSRGHPLDEAATRPTVAEAAQGKPVRSSPFAKTATLISDRGNAAGPVGNKLAGSRGDVRTLAVDAIVNARRLNGSSDGPGIDTRSPEAQRPAHNQLLGRLANRGGVEAEARIDGENSGAHVKIGAESHGKRNLVLGIGVVVALGAVFAFYQLSASSDAPKLQALAEFRTAFAEKCNVPGFSGPTPPFVVSEYLGSTRLQADVKTQAAALSAGKSCAEIEQALREASSRWARRFTPSSLRSPPPRRREPARTIYHPHARHSLVSIATIRVSRSAPGDAALGQQFQIPDTHPGRPRTPSLTRVQSRRPASGTRRVP